MLSFVQSWFTPGANPIGVDFGSDSLRLAQVDYANGEFRLVAAARADVPNHVRNDPAARLAFFTDSVRELWSQGNFRGRRAILSLPASVMNIQHLRLNKTDDATLKSALPWECRGKLPYDPTHALLRHMVAGEVFADGEQKHEVIVMAAQREWVNQFLAAAAKARLDVVGMNVEPKAVADCFSHIYRRKTDSESTNFYIDIGCGATRAVIARGSQIHFARSIAIGGDHFTRAVASTFRISAEDAKILRIKHCHAQTLSELNRPAIPAEIATDLKPGDRRGTAADPAANLPLPDFHRTDDPADRDAGQVEAACREPLNKLTLELALCRRYHEATFPGMHVDRLIFIGGEARHRSTCMQIAQSMDLAAQVGDPMVRMSRTTEVGPESGIDRRLPQPDWTVALGLTMGPQSAAAPVAVAAK